jgi:hypothetical protein
LNQALILNDDILIVPQALLYKLLAESDSNSDAHTSNTEAGKTLDSGNKKGHDKTFILHEC